MRQLGLAVLGVVSGLLALALVVYALVMGWGY